MMLIVLVMTAMFAVVVVIALVVIFAHALHLNHLGRCCLHGGGRRLAADSRTCRTADCSTQNRTVLAADVVADGGARRSAYRTADDSAAVNGIGIGAGGKEQGDRKLFFHDFLRDR